MLFNTCNSKLLYEEFHWIYLRGDIKLLLVTVNNRLILKIEIVHGLSCHSVIKTTAMSTRVLTETSLEQKCFPNGAGKTVMTLLRRDCPAVCSRYWRWQPEKLGCRP